MAGISLPSVLNAALGLAALAAAVFVYRLYRQRQMMKDLVNFDFLDKFRYFASDVS